MSCAPSRCSQGMTDRSVAAVAELAEPATFATRRHPRARRRARRDVHRPDVGRRRTRARAASRSGPSRPVTSSARSSLIDGGPRTATVTPTSAIEALGHRPDRVPPADGRLPGRPPRPRRCPDRSDACPVEPAVRLISGLRRIQPVADAADGHQVDRAPPAGARSWRAASGRGRRPSADRRRGPGPRPDRAAAAGVGATRVRWPASPAAGTPWAAGGRAPVAADLVGDRVEDRRRRRPGVAAPGARPRARSSSRSSRVAQLVRRRSSSASASSKPRRRASSRASTAAAGSGARSAGRPGAGARAADDVELVVARRWRLEDGDRSVGTTSGPSMNGPCHRA